MSYRSELYRSFINDAINALKTEDYEVAQEHIKKAMLEDCHAPEVHNLLGILAELMGDLSLAGKHYRAAYALDPTYKPPSKNLERITSFFCRAGETNPDYGEEQKEEKVDYIIKKERILVIYKEGNSLK